MIRLCPNTKDFSMMDKQFNVIKKYCTDCATRGFYQTAFGGLRDIAVIPCVHSLVHKILTKLKYKKGLALLHSVHCCFSFS